MTVEKTQNGDALVLIVEGRLDTITAPQLDQEIQSIPADVKSLTLDFAQLDYVSSAGLRVLLTAQKKMTAATGKMVVKGVQPAVMEVFAVTGFDGILSFE